MLFFNQANIGFPKLLAVYNRDQLIEIFHFHALNKTIHYLRVNDITNVVWKIDNFIMACSPCDMVSKNVV